MRKTILCLLLLAAPAQAQMPAMPVVGGSNNGFAPYPAPACTKPVTPQPVTEKPPSPTEPGAMDNYNAKVRKYNEGVAGYNGALKTFAECMRIYVDNGNADMERIKETVNAAVAAANAKP